MGYTGQLGVFENDDDLLENLQSHIDQASNIGLVTRVRARVARFFGYKVASDMVAANKFLARQLNQSNIFDRTKRMPYPYAARATYDHGGGDAISYTPQLYDLMFFLVLNNSTARPMLVTRKIVIFRPGFVIKPKFEKKCLDCGKEHEFDVNECQNELCQSKALREPSIVQKNALQELIKPTNHMNRNRQNLTALLKEVLGDIDIADDGWVAITYTYWHVEGKIITKDMMELWRVHPAHIAWSFDHNNIIGQYEFTCIDHRLYSSQDPFGRCEECNSELHPVIAVRYAAGTMVIIFRYIEGEILHSSLYRPSALYGYPPALTMDKLLRMTYKMEEYMGDYYDKKRVPNAWLGIPTKRPDTVREQMEWSQKKLREDKFSIPWFNYDPDKPAKPELITMHDTPKELELIASRDEARGRFGHMWGVSPILQMDTSTGGGLNNDGLQYTVTNQAGEEAQNAINQNFLSFIALAKGCVDYDLELAPIEERDEVAEIERDIKKAQLAQLWIQNGYNAEYQEDGDWKPVKPDPIEQDPFMQLFQNQDNEMQHNSNSGGFGTGVDEPHVQHAVSDQMDNAMHKAVSYEGSPGQPPTVGQLHRMLELLESGQINLNLLPESQQNESIIEDYYTFTDELPDWDGFEDYEIVGFTTLHTDEITRNPDFEIKESDIEKQSERVRPMTIIHYLTETREMKRLIVDNTPSHNLFDGNHRDYCLKKKNQENIGVIIVKPKEVEPTEITPRMKAVAEQMRAPTGGITIKGELTKGGRFIRKELLESLTNEELEMVQSGQDVL